MSGWAAPKTIVVHNGDCTDAAFLARTKELRDAAGALLGPALMEPEVVLDIVRPRSGRSPQDIERQVESAKALFYAGQADRALELIERALVELERVSPETKTWPLTQAALVLQALIFKNLDRPREVQEAFRRIVRLEPTFKLNPDAYPPTAISALEAARKEVGRARKSTLQVRAEAGAAATVFVDGRPMGAAPLKVELVQGVYRVSLVGPQGSVSFSHRVEVPREKGLSVDLAFEGSLSPHPPLCLSGSERGAALKLAQLVTAERVLVLSNTSTGSQLNVSGWLYEPAQEKAERSGSISGEPLANLVTFLLTGKQQPGVLPAREVPLNPTPARIEGAPLPPMVQAQSLPATPLADTGKGSSPEGQASAGKVASFVLLGLGGAATLSGILTYTGGESARARLQEVRDAGKFPLAQLPAGTEALSLVEQVNGNRTVAFAFLGAGAGALAAGAIGLALFSSGDTPGATATIVTISPQPAGASLSVLGFF